jgi:glycosyltransferase involved in cell wall biosynthesis
MVLRIMPVTDGQADRYLVRPVGGNWHATPLRLTELLAAADVFVAAAHDLEACTPAAAAVACGMPVIAATTDSSAELVLSGSRGFVVPPRPERIAQAVLAQIDGGLPRRPAAAPDEPHRLVDVARSLLTVYRHVMCAPIAVGGAA